MEWIKAKNRTPSKSDSPILAFGKLNKELFDCSTLQWLDEEEGWNGPGWYDYNKEYGMKQNEIEWWTPLPIPPKD